MPSSETIQVILGIIVIAGTAFNIWIAIRKPQENSEKTDIKLGEQLRQLQTDFTNLRDNHVHTLDTKLDETNKAVQNLAIEVAKLTTVINERIPKRR